MLFSINENGSLDFDENRKIFSDFVMSNEEETNFRLTRTILITHLIHKKWLKNNFILYKRINYTDEEIKVMIKNKLNELFKNYPNLKNTVEFSFTLKNNILSIVFYKKQGEDNRLILIQDVNIG